MAPNLAWYESTDTTVETSVSLDVVPGTPSAALELHLWNAKGSTAETAENLRLLVAVRNPGDTYFVSEGRPPVDQRWIQAQIVGTEGAVTTPLTGWQQLGAGAWLDLPNIPQNSAVKVQFRVVAPPGVGSSPLEVDLQLDWSTSEAIGDGHTSDPDGVFQGIGDQRFYGLILGGAVTPDGSPDATVNIAWVSWIAAGTPFALAAGTNTFNDQDSASAHLASGQEYKALLSGGPTGALVVTKGLLAATGASVAPALPAGNVLLATITVPYGLAIGSGDIADGRVLSRYTSSSSGLIMTISPGSGRVDNFLTLSTIGQQVTLADASSGASCNRVWLNPDGSISATVTSTPTNVGAHLLYEADTASGAVTAVRDRRIFIGPALRQLRVRFYSPLGAGNPSDHDVNTESRTLYLDPERPLVLSLNDLGATLSSGSSQIDVQLSVAGGAWTSIFAAAGNMPAIPYNATNEVLGPDQSCTPTTLAIPPGARVKAVVNAVPTGTTPPSGWDPLESTCRHASLSIL